MINKILKITVEQSKIFTNNILSVIYVNKLE